MTNKEAAQALCELNNDKSPGPDGFTMNFLKFFWKELGGFLVRSLNLVDMQRNVFPVRKNKASLC